MRFEVANSGFPFEAFMLKPMCDVRGGSNEGGA